jgi:malate dehydrogenase (oxaloacetate-decarboxylating)(NADP+)
MDVKRTSGTSGKRPNITEEEALRLHAGGRPGKLEIQATKPLTTQRDLALAYSPGVAIPTWGRSPPSR